MRWRGKRSQSWALRGGPWTSSSTFPVGIAAVGSRWARCGVVSRQIQDRAFHKGLSLDERSLAMWTLAEAKGSEKLKSILHHASQHMSKSQEALLEHRLSGSLKSIRQDGLGFCVSHKPPGKVDVVYSGALIPSIPNSAWQTKLHT